MKLFTLFLAIITCTFSFSQNLMITNYVEGTLLMPNKKTETLVIIIPGSGPTDRDGNQNFVKNNSLKFLAEDLTAEGFATFRYDKRAIIMLKNGTSKNAISKVRFDDFVADAKKVISYFAKQNSFKNIYILDTVKGL